MVCLEFHPWGEHPFPFFSTPFHSWVAGPKEEHMTQSRQIHVLSHPQDLELQGPCGLGNAGSLCCLHTGRARLTKKTNEEKADPGKALMPTLP